MLSRSGLLLSCPLHKLASNVLNDSTQLTGASRASSVFSATNWPYSIITHHFGNCFRAVRIL